MTKEEKNQKKKPKIEMYVICPECFWSLTWNDEHFRENYCPKCGQGINWSSFNLEEFKKWRVERGKDE